MEKKYQVFISSTYTDLKSERTKAIHAVLMADCFPIGMESFVAQNDEQFSVIKKVIDLCDFYVLIIGGKYGSIEPKTQKSYTQLEYEYAVSQNIPILVFAVDNYESCPRDDDELARSKFVVFRNEVLKSRLAKIFKSPDELFGFVIASLYNAKIEFSRPGWIRGGKNNESELLQKIYDLERENKDLQKQLSEHSSNNDYSFLENKVKLHYVETLYAICTGRKIQTKDIETTYKELFIHLSYFLTSEINLHDYKEAVNKFVQGYHTSETEAFKIKAQFIINGLFSERNYTDKKGNVETLVSLSKKGKELMLKLSNL